jgi:RNA recognition motif-containing protein
MTKRIYVGNLPSHTTEHELRGLFERAGPVVSVRLVTDRDTGRAKGFGFVEMGREEAEHAIRQLNRAELHGHTLSVTEARPRPEASATRGLPSVRLFVGNLPYTATAQELRDFFSAVGLVAAVSLPVERESGKPRGFAFVEFPDRAQAAEAVRRFHAQPFHGRALVVTEAQARESRPPTPFSLPPSQPSQPWREGPAVPPPDELLSRPGGPRRPFGPDAAAPRERKPPSRGPKSERRRSKPIPERKGGQFFAAGDGEPDEETFAGTHRARPMRAPESGEEL